MRAERNLIKRLTIIIIVHGFRPETVLVTNTRTCRLTALHYAVQRSHLSIIRVLVRYPGLTHLPQGEGRTPLMMAAIAKGDGLLQALQVYI